MQQSPLRPFLVIIVLWFAGLGAAMQFAKFAVPFTLLQELYPQAGASLGWLLTLISAIGAVLGIVAGDLVARFGCRRLLVCALILGGALSFWQASLPSFLTLMLSRVIEGLSHLSIVVAAPTLIAQICPERFRGAAMALWSTFFGVAFALTAWIGGPIAERYGLAALLSVHGVWLLSVAALLALLLSPTDETKQAATPWNLRQILMEHVVVYRSPFMAAPAIGWWFYTLTFVSLITLLPGLVTEERRFAVATLMPIASICVSLGLVPFLLNQISAVTTVIIGFLLSAGVMMTYFVGVPVFTIAVLLFGALGLVQGASFAAIPDLNRQVGDRARANGALAQMGNLGNLLGTPLLLLLIEGAGIAATVTAMTALYGLGALSHILFARARHSKPTPT